MLELARQGPDALLIAPTGGGKTLGGFLPSLVELHEAGSSGRLHTLYVSPLKALATDIAPQPDPAGRGDGAAGADRDPHRRHAAEPARRQRTHPPDMLLTTPESWRCCCPTRTPADYFASLRCVVLDELHALAETSAAPCQPGAGARCGGWRRGAVRRAVGDGGRCRRALRAICRRGRRRSRSSGRPRRGAAGRACCCPRARCPGLGTWRSTRPCDVYELIRERAVTLVFVNTRAQAELMFGALWRSTRRTCRSPCTTAASRRAAPQGRGGHGARRAARRGLHLLARPRHRLGRHRPGGPGGRAQGRSRLLQRIGRANHRLDEPSRAPAGPRQPVRGAGVHRRRRTPSRSARWTAVALLPAGSTCWPSTSSAWPAPGRSTPTTSTPRSPARPLRRAARAAISTPCSTSSRPAATRSRPTTASAADARRGRALAAPRPRVARPVPHECRHHRRGAVMRGAARRGQVLGEVEEYFVRC